MCPILFNFGDFAIYTWGAAFCLSVIIGVTVSKRRAPRFGVAPEVVKALATIIIIASLAGSRIWYVLYHLDKYQEHWTALIMTAKGGRIACSGLSMTGGVVLALLGSLIYARIKGLKFPAIGDVIAPAFLLGSGIQRLGGCFMSGCCYGLPTQGIFGIVFPNISDAGRHFPGTPLWPSQLIASALGFAGYALILWFERRHRFPGCSFCLVFLYHPIERLLVDQIRFYEPAQILGNFGPLTINVNHPLLLGLFIVSAALWLQGWLRSKGGTKA